MTSNLGSVGNTNTATERARRGAEKSADARRGRKRTPHPLTSDVIYHDDQFEFIKAMEHFQLTTGTKFPTTSQYLGVLKSLGYTKTAREKSD
jgi:hypothetical protein